MRSPRSSGASPPTKRSPRVWTAERVRGVKDALPDATSLNQALSGEEGASEIGDFVEDERASDTAGEVLREMETSGLAAAVDGLPERQRYVLVRRYGLGADEKPATLAEISDELGVSKERVRQLQRDAERMLRERHYERAFSVAA
jgi:RNA polymerase primary sigma factor